jgi:hypothetical protein
VNAGSSKLERAMASETGRDENLSEAWTLFGRAVRHEPDCMEAIYNAGLTAKAMEQYDLALEQFILLNGMMPNQVSSYTMLRLVHLPFHMFSRHVQHYADGRAVRTCCLGAG